MTTQNSGGAPSVGVVVVGTGFGCLTHVPALRAAGFDVVGLVGRDAERTEARARRFAIPHALTSFEAALALPGVAAVTIATPPHTHAPLTLEALAAGKHVLCEKPLARDAAEAATMLAAADAAGLVHLVGAEFRWATGQRLAARAIDGGPSASPAWPPSSSTSRCWPIPTPRSRRGGPTPTRGADGSGPTPPTSSTRSAPPWGSSTP